MAQTKPLQRPNWLAWLPWLMLAGGLCMTLWVTYVMHDHNERSALRELDARAAEAAEAVRDRMETLELTLTGGAELLHHRDGSGREDWRRYVDRLQFAKKLEGVLGVAFTQVILPQDLESHIAAIRAEGFPDYTVHPPGPRELYTSIVYIEPFTGRNLAAFGFDMLSEPVRASAMRTAAETGQAALSGVVRLVQETHGPVQPGVLIYVPVYRGGGVPATAEQRWASLAGWAYSPLRAGDLLQALLPRPERGVSFAVYDATDATPVLLFSTPAPKRSGSPLRSRVDLELHGRRWQIVAEAGHSFTGKGAHDIAQLLVFGTAISLLLAGLTWTLIKRRAEALALAERMTASLAAERERLASIIEGTRIGTWEWNVQTGAVIFNERWADICGYTLAELQPVSVQTWFALAHPEDIATSNAALERHFSGEADYYDVECRMRHKLGHWVWVHARGRLVSRSEDGKPLMMYGTHTDITERKRVERIKDEFVSTVSHELRTPLTAISGALGLVSSGVLGELSAEAKTYIGIAANNCQRLTLLVNDLLDMDKIAAGKMEYDLQTHALRSLLERSVAEAAEYARQCQVDLRLAPVPDTYRVHVDAGRFQQILTNLLANAAKFSPPGSPVEITCVPTDGEVRIQVKDYGPGIPLAFQPRVFEKFAQADSSNTRQKGGTGLGLAISRELARRMGGEIEFESREGAGSMFWLRLPLV